jgi:hypothetical protein
MLTIQTMDEVTIKTPIPKCCLCWCLCLGWCSNFVGSEYGRKQSVKLQQNLVYYTCQDPPPSPPPNSHTQSVYSEHLLWGGVGDVREKVEGQQFTRGSENTNRTDCISSL